jgi:hypothetical protein
MAANVGQVVTSAWQKMIGKKPGDAIFNEYAFLAWAEKGAGEETGGRSIIFPLEYKVNTTVRSLGSPTETLDTTAVEVFDEGEAQWKQYAGTFVMTSYEEAINRGDSAKIKLEKGKLDNLRKSMRKELNSDLVASTAGNDLAGLQELVADTPTSGTVEGINRGTWEFFRNQTTSGAKTTTIYDNLRAAMRTIRTACAKGQGVKFPSDYWMSATTSNAYEGLLIANERVVGKDDKDANAAFSGESYLFGKAKVRWDDDLGDTRVYALNKEDYKIVHQSGYWFKGYAPERPANQLANIFAVETICQAVALNPRHLGVITAVTS